jgi:hypothetical protein
MPSMMEIRRGFPPGRFYLVGTPAVIKAAQEFGWFDEYWTIDDRSLGRLLWTSGVAIWRMARQADHLERFHPDWPYPAWRRKFRHSPGEKHFTIPPSSFHSASTVRWAFFLRIDLILENAISIGLRSGL